MQLKRGFNKMKKKLLFVTTQFYKGGAEMALLRLFRSLSPKEYAVDFLLTDQMELHDARSLLDEIPSWVRVCNASVREGKLAVVGKIWYKVIRRLSGRQMFRRSARRFVKGQTYDAAFSYGEWMPPAFVADIVRADKKMLWIHTDIDKVKSVNAESLFAYEDAYDTYIFVSEHSRKCAEERFAACRGKSAVVHNMCGDAQVRKAAQEEIAGLKHFKRPCLLSVGNLREEKNYPRQVEIMHLLKERGINLTWLCIGSRANPIIDQKVRKMIRRYGLEKCFLLLGVQDNPYAYMKQADAVMSLSDFESWSLVITEAKLLGVPVIATPTSGAAEQIIDSVNGVIVPFSPKEAADRIERFLKNPKEQAAIRLGLQGFSTDQPVMEEFRALFGNLDRGKRNTKKKILYLFDNINYESGARKAAFLQIGELREHCQVHLFSLCRPDGAGFAFTDGPGGRQKRRRKDADCGTDWEPVAGLPILGSEIWKQAELAVRPFHEVMRSAQVHPAKKVQRAWYAAAMRIGKADACMGRMIGRRFIRAWEQYDAVVVVSEASRLRGVVSRLNHPKKIQWIHTDYVSWSRFSEWTRAAAAQDGRIYQNFDRIVSLSEHSRKGFVEKYPRLHQKSVVIPNLIDGETIQKKAAQTAEIWAPQTKRQAILPRGKMDWQCAEIDRAKSGCLCLVSVGRADREKGYDQMFTICRKMQAEGCRFLWYLVGDGPLLPHLQERVRTEGLTGCIRLTGWMDNPYPLMKRCDWLVLPSRYEGTPVTVDEAMTLGLAVVAVDTGGIREQLQRGGDCWYGYVESGRDFIDRVCGIIRNGERRAVTEPFDYDAWNRKVSDRLLKLFS